MVSPTLSLPAQHSELKHKPFALTVQDTSGYKCEGHIISTNRLFGDIACNSYSTEPNYGNILNNEMENDMEVIVA
jgi:hypothetical protein